MEGKATRLAPTAKVLAILALSVTTSAVGADSAGLIDSREVLQKLESAPAATGAPSLSDAAQLRSDIVAFRSQSATIEPKQAAATWFALLDRAQNVGATDLSQDYHAYDIETRNVVGVRSVLASLPPPAAWPALREEAHARASRAPQEIRVIALRLMMELLMQDSIAAQTSLTQIEKLAAGLPPDDRGELLYPAAELRETLAELYGTPDEITATFVSSLTPDPARPNPYAAKSIPDLVGLVGEARAAAILREIIVRPITFSIASGDETRALARKIAIERIDALAQPQWGLVNSIEAADLYEALSRRFDVKQGDSEADVEVSSQPGMASFHRASADIYYFLAMLLQGNEQAALDVFTRMAKSDRVEIPRPAIEALQKLGRQDVLYSFLHATLPKHPEWRAWDVYIEQASYTGHATDALALVDSLLARKDLPDFVQADLRAHRINALLARDDVAPATRALRELLKTAPKAGDRDLDDRVKAAARLAGLGRVLSKPDLSEAGIAFLRKAVELPRQDASGYDPNPNKALVALLAELRKTGRYSQAQSVALDEMARSAGNTNQYEQLGFEVTSPARLLAMTELVSLYVAAGRHEDAVALMEGSTKWGARDLSTLMEMKDSQGVPLAMSAARALAATGNKAAALSVLKALIRAMPGYDPAYELLVSVEPQPLPLLEQIYQRDAFEERPLIWQAIVLRQQESLDQAKAVIQRALAIDPSDGEEGPNDRMRGYAVLADILVAQGDARTASEYRNAVAAIRISERSDELHALGLYQRAFAGYREALTHFQDAYCIQSRLAVQLAQQGRRSEALEHYRRAYELMPASFGRVESHCFGCESVFEGNEPQGIAEEVFARIVARNPKSPQPHYLLGYLREEQRRHADALQHYRTAVSLDPDYLNAWKHLDSIGEHVYVDAKERDIARIRLLELDPRQQHVKYAVSSVGDLALLWRTLERASAGDTAPNAVYSLRRSAEFYDQAVAKLPDVLREQMMQYRTLALGAQSMGSSPAPMPRAAIAGHSLMVSVARLMGVQQNEFGE